MAAAFIKGCSRQWLLHQGLLQQSLSVIIITLDQIYSTNIDSASIYSTAQRCVNCRSKQLLSTVSYCYYYKTTNYFISAAQYYVHKIFPTSPIVQTGFNSKPQSVQRPKSTVASCCSWLLSYSCDVCSII
jgi:hypothetical protein